MKTTDKHISLSLAKKITEAAVKAGVELPESEFFWVRVFYLCDLEKNGKDGFVLDNDGNFWRWELHQESDSVNEFDGKWLPSYDVAELGEILRGIKSATLPELNDSREYFNLIYNSTFLWREKNEIKARGEMLLFLINENELN